MNGLKIGDYVRWKYPLGYVDNDQKTHSHGLITDISEGIERWDGRVVLLLDTKYKQSFWLSLDLLIELGELEVLCNGDWTRII
tara:strand:+ start:47 stop:295 length:249 start_codon:yes stop_codon:yes gene_type:complete